VSDRVRWSYDGQPVVLGRPSGASGASFPLPTSGGSAPAQLRAESGRYGPWTLLVASVTGLRHRLAGRGNEDAYGWAVAEGGAVVAVVADGVGGEDGSAAAAGAAAAAAATAGAAAMTAGAGRGDALDAALQAANRAAEACTGATTLVVVVAEADGGYAAARVGDSSALVRSGCGWSELFAAPDDRGDGLVMTATAALPAEDPPVQAADGVLGDGDVLILVTDGIAGPIADGPTTVAPVFAEALAEPPTPLALAALVDFSRQGCHDDRTLLGLWRRRPDQEVGADILGG
jgi:serine/threonine protein phosphatase PrpC